MENRDDQNKNQTGQQDQQGQQFTDKQGQSSSGQTGTDKGAFGEAGADTTLAQGQKSEQDKLSDKKRQDESGSDKGFVGTSKEDDSSEAYLTEGETTKSDFAEQGQGANQSPTGNEDIESGTTTNRDARLDDGS